MVWPLTTCDAWRGDRVVTQVDLARPGRHATLPEQPLGPACVLVKQTASNPVDVVGAYSWEQAQRAGPLRTAPTSAMSPPAGLEPAIFGLEVRCLVR